MTSTEENIRNLELECHYLSQALEKLKRRSPEWDFLQEKLGAAEEELEAMRQDREIGDGYPSPPHRTSYSDDPTRRPYSDEPTRRPYSDDPDGSESDRAARPSLGYHDDNGNRNEGYGDRNQLFDDSASYEPAVEGGAGYHPKSTRRRMSGIPRKAAATAVVARGWTEPRRKILGCFVFFAVAALVSCILFFTLDSEGGSPSSAANEGTVNVAPTYTEPCAGFTAFLIPDQYGNETSWKIIRYEGVEMANLRQAQESQGTVVLQGGPYSYKEDFDSDGGGDHYEMVQATTCLPEGSYTFVLSDVKGDGICCDYGRGEYGMKLSNGRVIRPLSLGKFTGKKQVTAFQVTPDDIDYIPAPSSMESTAGNDLTGAASPLLDTSPVSTTPDVPDGPCASFQMHLILDQFGNETSWKVRRYDGVDMSHLREAHQAHNGTIVLQGGPYDYKKDFEKEATGSHYDMIHASTCLPIGVYTFILYDSKGDGICCDYGHGEFGVSLSKGREIRPLSAGKFTGAGEVTPFEVTADDIDVLPELPSSSMDTAATDPSNGSLTPLGANSGVAEEPCSSFSLHLVPDQFGNETSWKVLRKSQVQDEGRNTQGLSPPHSSTIIQNGQFSGRHLRQTATSREVTYSRKAQATRQREEWTAVLSGGPYSYRTGFDSEGTGSHYNAIIAETCLPEGSYKFEISDVKGDGMCCDYGRGEYGINLAKGRVVRPLSPGKFSSEEVTLFDVTADDLDVVPEPVSSAGAVANDSSGTEPSPSDNLDTSGPETNVDIVDTPAAPADTSSNNPQGVSSAVLSRPITQKPMTSVNSLASLVTVPTDVTTMGRGKSYGILFDVEAGTGTSSLLIAGMDLYLDAATTTHYEIWTKQGSWQDVASAANPDYSTGFRQVSHGSVTGTGALDFTKIALRDFQDVEVPAGQRQAFWVTLSDNNLVFKSYEGEGVSRHEMANEVQAAKEELKVYYGAAVRAYPLELADPETDFWNNAGFLGRLWYKNG